MSEWLIFFLVFMVCVILFGMKMQMWCVVKLQLCCVDGGVLFGDVLVWVYVEFGSMVMCCFYGKCGDWLWVCEIFYVFGCWEMCFSVKKGCDEWYFVDMMLESGWSYLFEVLMGWMCY